MTANPPLEPKRLLPALLRFSEEGAPPACRSQALRYIRFCMDRQQSSDPAVHQLAVRPLPRGGVLLPLFSRVRQAFG